MIVWALFICMPQINQCQMTHTYAPYFSTRAECQRTLASYNGILNAYARRQGVHYVCLSRHVETWR